MGCGPPAASTTLITTLHTPTTTKPEKNLQGFYLHIIYPLLRWWRSCRACSWWCPPSVSSSPPCPPSSRRTTGPVQPTPPRDSADLHVSIAKILYCNVVFFYYEYNLQRTNTSTSSRWQRRCLWAGSPSSMSSDSWQPRRSHSKSHLALLKFF